jgi:hypothetical protein
MAEIKSYPLKSTYFGNDRLILSDMEPDSSGNILATTKNITMSSLKANVGGGLTLTTTGTSGASTFDASTNTLNVPNYSAGVTTFNTLSGAVTISGGNNITLTNVSQNVEITCDIAAGDGLDLTGFTLSTDLKANGGLVIESTELAVDLGASSITGTLAIADGGTGVVTSSKYSVLVGTASGYETSASSTGAIQLPAGTTAQRPSGIAGLIRYNTDESFVEIYNGSNWVALAVAP